MPRAHDEAQAILPPEGVAAPQTTTPAAVTHTSRPSQPPRVTPPAWTGMSTEDPQNSSQTHERAIEPPKKSRIGFWIAAVSLIAAVLAITGLLAREKMKERVQRMRGGQAVANRATPTTGVTLSTPSATADAADRLNQKIMTGAAMAGANQLVQVLFESATTAGRLKAIANPASHQDEVAAVFDGGGEPPALIALTPISTLPISLLTHQRMPMFKVTTSGNRAGALVSLSTGASGVPLINWPLLHETHERLLTRHIEAKDQNPKWFHVGLRRVHSFELPASARDQFDAMDIDGSTDGTGHIVTYVAKESALGRHFSNLIEWGGFYFGRVLVCWMEIGGEMRPALLDCERSNLPPAAEGAGQPVR